MIPEHFVRSLAISSLPNHRQGRPHVGEAQLFLRDFSDGEAICVLYRTLGELATALRGDAERRTAARSGFHHRLQALLRAPGGIGVGFGEVREPVARALHDIRGGTMTALLVGLDERPRAPPYGDEAGLLSLIRDQRKILRSTVADIDREGRAQDAAETPHSLLDLQAGMSSFARARAAEEVSIEIRCDGRATVAESCLEFAWLERAVFNLLNNAMRHVSGDRVDVWLLAGRDDATVAIANPVSRVQSRLVAAAIDDDPTALYRGFTTTGSGLGLAIVAEVVGSAYGLADTTELVVGGYVGTRIIDEAFLSWLHWPLSAKQ